MSFVFCHTCGCLTGQPAAPQPDQPCRDCGDAALHALDLPAPQGTGFFLQRAWLGAQLNERSLRPQDVEMLLYDFSTAATRQQDALDMTEAYQGLKDRYPQLDLQDWINDMLEALNRAFEHEMSGGPGPPGIPDLPQPSHAQDAADLTAPPVEVPDADVPAARPWTQALTAIRVSRRGDPFLHFLVENWFAYAYPRYMGRAPAPEPQRDPAEPQRRTPAGDGTPQERERPGAGCLFSLVSLASIAAVVGLLAAAAAF